MKNLICLENLNYSIPYGPNIFKDINFNVGENEFLGVFGPKGAGKTTLIDLILGARPSTSGKIEVLGENPIGNDRKQLSSICYLSHDSVVKETLSIAQYLKFYASMYPSYSKTEEKKLLKYFSLNSKVQIGTLSTSQKKIVQVIGALSTFPKLILIDNITAEMDTDIRDLFFGALDLLKEKNGLSVVLATNIAEDLISRADRVLFIDQGRGSLLRPEEILKLSKLRKGV